MARALAGVEAAFVLVAVGVPFAALSLAAVRLVLALVHRTHDRLVGALAFLAPAHVVAFV